MAIIKTTSPTKRQFVARYRDILAVELGRDVTLTEAETAHDALITTIGSIQAEGRDVSIKGFGRFGLLYRKSPEGKKINARFKPSGLYRDMLRSHVPPELLD